MFVTDNIQQILYGRYIASMQKIKFYTCPLLLACQDSEWREIPFIHMKYTRDSKFSSQSPHHDKSRGMQKKLFGVVYFLFKVGLDPLLLNQVTISLLGGP